MKLFIIIGIMAACLLAIPLTSTIPTVYPEWEQDTVLASSAFDTLAGATDSITLCTKYKVEPGFEYMLVKSAITGTGSDSIKLIVYVDAFDFATSSTALYRTSVDSIIVAAGEIMGLGIGTNLIGNAVTIKLLSYADNGGQVIVNGLQIWKRKSIMVQKKY